jgi:glycine dehydrogenase
VPFLEKEPLKMQKFEFYDQFVNRHIGPGNDDITEMVSDLGLSSLDELIDKTVPQGIRLPKKLNLRKPQTEFEFSRELKEIAKKNKIFKSYIGMGYYPTITPAVIQRNILENPGWYTQYTPYQTEISQGRLEALINFQTMVSDLTGMELTNASLLDEATSAGEAMAMLMHLEKAVRNRLMFSWWIKMYSLRLLMYLKRDPALMILNLSSVELRRLIWRMMYSVYSSSIRIIMEK